MQGDNLRSEVYKVKPCDQTTCQYYDEWSYYRSGKNRQIIIGKRAYSNSHVLAQWCLSCKHFSQSDHFKLDEEAAAKQQKAVEEKKATKPASKGQG
jgi:exopolysaccharide biosynthesis protein